MHDATKVLMGTTYSSLKEISSADFSQDPADFPAGTVLRLKSDGTCSKSLSDGSNIGVSIGKSMSDTNRVSVIKTGKGVPVLLTDIAAAASGAVTITDYADLIDTGFDEITVGSVTFVAQAGAAVLGTATFRAATSDEATATSLGAQINGHDDLDGVVVAVVDGDEVTITAVEEGTDGNAIALTYSDEGTDTEGATVTGSGFLTGGVNSYDYAVKGTAVFVHDTTGIATEDEGNSTVTGAIYVSGQITGIDETGAEVAVALIDMVGGL